jgi:predicted dehydrogenase
MADQPGLRVAVIGLGVGEKHAEAYVADPRSAVAIICDIDAQKLADVGARFPEARRIEDPIAAITDPDVDLVSIASYDDAHFEQVELALTNGKHVFSEKPLCLRREHAERIQALLAAHPELHLSSNLPLRRSPRFRGLREQIQAGELGTLYYLEADYEYGRLHKITGGWRRTQDNYSVMLGGGVHVVDLLLWLTGRDVVRVQAAANGLATAGEGLAFGDFEVAILEFDNGLIAKASANFACVTPHFHAVKVFGSEGTFVNAIGSGVQWSRDADGLRESAVESPYPGIHKGDLIAPFLDSIIGGVPPEVSAEEVFRTLDVCFAIDRSIAERTAVEPQGFG